MTSAVISVPAANTVPPSRSKLVPGGGVLHPSVKSVSSTGVSITKVFPSASQSALVRVTVTLASDSNVSTQSAPAQVSPAGGATLKVWLVVPGFPSSSVTVRVTVTGVSSMNEYVCSGLGSTEVLSGLVGSPKSHSQDAIPLSSVLPSVKVHSSELHST